MQHDDRDLGEEVACKKMFHPGRTEKSPDEKNPGGER
jgi:hypothetical protein